MLVSHNFSEKKAEKEVYNNPQFLLLNKIGGFFTWQEKPESRYGGLHHKFQNKIFKSIESLELHGDNKIKSIKNNFWNFEVQRENNLRESFFMPYGKDVLVYEINKEVSFDLILDIKEMFDNDEWNRTYDISESGGKIIIEYTKSKDGKKLYSFFIVVKSNDFTYKIKKDWVLKDYKHDFKRNDPPFGRYVFSALELEGYKFVFSISENKEKAVKEAEYVFNNLNNIKKDHKNSVFDFESQNDLQIFGNEVGVAHLAAKFSLANMVVYNLSGSVEGLYAGIPWFSQFWARDSLLSLAALPAKIKLELFLKYLEELKNSGEISSCSTGCLKSAGAHGLFFKRAEDLMAENLLTQNEIFDIKNILVSEIEKVLAESTLDDFAVNGPKETWMDTQYQDSSREGVRIEMQALRLTMYNLAAKLTGQRRYFELEHKLSKKVREYFFNGESLKDGIGDKEVRPNAFLAFYIYPDLLFKHEWSKVFLSAMDDLWLLWGGFSSISKNSPLFCGEHRGCSEPNQSYHHGDSWYFMNNMAAIALKKTDIHKFKKQIELILRKNTEEILWSGILGHHAEVSSADKFTSFGCLAQSWSVALYVEALEEVSK